MPTGPARYAICPACARAVPAETGERYCSNDGTPLIAACPGCAQPVLSPYALYCPRCAAPYGAHPEEEP